MDRRVRYRAARAAGRIAQGIDYLAPKRAGRIDAELRQLLGPAEFALVSRLSVADRAHLLAVYRRLVRWGWRDPDLLRAALLHDIGKVDDDIRVGLIHRTLAVILRASAPSVFQRLTQPCAAGWRRPFWLIREHAALGARKARDAGCAERVCWLIEHHHDACVGDDAALQALQQADEG